MRLGQHVWFVYINKAASKRVVDHSVGKLVKTSVLNKACRRGRYLIVFLVSS